MCGVWVVPIVGGISPVKQERMLKKLPEVAALVMHHKCSCNLAVLIHFNLRWHVMQHELQRLFAFALASYTSVTGILLGHKEIFIALTGCLSS